MGYKQSKITFEDAKNKFGDYPYALVNMMSEVCIGKTSDIDVLWEELLEARFFSSGAELHIFKYGKEWRAVIITDDGSSDDVLVKSYPLASKFQNAGNELVVKEYLNFDEDGQAYVELTRLSGITGGQKNE